MPVLTVARQITFSHFRKPKGAYEKIAIPVFRHAVRLFGLHAQLPGGAAETGDAHHLLPGLFLLQSRLQRLKIRHAERRVTGGAG